MTTRRTKRRYAHELYPHAAEFDLRPLSVEVPYLYARAIGLETSGTSWASESPATAMRRTSELMDARKIALLADALHQGLTGDSAWAWVEQHHWDYDGSMVWDRARQYGVQPREIKPYPCGPEPSSHYHYGPPDDHGWRHVTTIDGPESECPDCTEEGDHHILRDSATTIDRRTEAGL